MGEMVVLRRATAADAPGIASVHVGTWREAYREILPASYLIALDVTARERWWTTELAVLPHERMPWVAVADGEIVGFAAAGPARDDAALPTMGEVYAIYVLPRYWAMGVGRSLLDHAERDLVGHGYTQATLWVLADNDRARRFYEAAGWVVDAGSARVDTIGSHEVNEVRYRVALRPTRPA